MPAEKDLQEAFKEAAEIAKVVPESMQGAAFHRALDQILGEGESAGRQTPPRKRSTQRKTKAEDSKVDSGADDLVGRINRTQYPEITEKASVLDRSLLVLQAAQEHGVDGLNAGQISSILKDKFRVRTSRRGVAMALDGAKTFVDRSRSGNQVIFKIMGAGEQHLQKRSDEQASGEEKQTPRRTRRKRSSTSSRTSGRKESGGSSGSSARKRRGRPGPKAAIEDLIDARFFDTARTMADVQERLRAKVGHRYKATDLSPSFGRLLREGRLDRERNDDGKYEYSAK